MMRSLPAIFLVTLLLGLPSCTFIRQRLPFGKYSLRVAKEWAKKDSLRVADSLNRAVAANKAFERMPNDSMKRIMSDKKDFEKTLTDSLMSLEDMNFQDGSASTSYHIIIGSFTNHANAQKAAKKYSTQGFKTAIITKYGNDGIMREMVSVKVFSDREKASLFLKEFKGKYDPGAWLYTGK